MPGTLERTLQNPGTKAERKIAELGPWFHNLHLPDGTQTAPGHKLGDFPKFKWEAIARHLPADLSGWKVLDIGCNAGFYSFELARRGADVLGIDVDERYLKQAEWAKEIFNLQNKVQFKYMQIYELLKFKREFDLVLFMGVFYHLRYPLLALDIISNIFKKLLIFQTLTMPGDVFLLPPENLNIDERYLMLNDNWPKMAFIENRLEGDFTNWWALNNTCIEALMNSCGIKIIKKPAHEIYMCEQIPTFNKIMINNELDFFYSLINEKKNNGKSR